MPYQVFGLSVSTVYTRTAALGHSDKHGAVQVLKDADQLVRVGDPPGVAGQHAGLFHVVVADGVGLRSRRAASTTATKGSITVQHWKILC